MTDDVKQPPHTAAPVGLLDGGVQGACQHIAIVREVHHELLLVLHDAKGLGVGNVGVVKEQVALCCQLDLQRLHVRLTLHQDLDSNGFQGANFMRSILRLLTDQRGGGKQAEVHAPWESW